MNWKPINRAIPTTLGMLAAQEAASKCGYDRPTLWVHPDSMGYAEEVAEACRYNIRTDPAMGRDEWFVEWGGERWGSDLELDQPNPNMRVQLELAIEGGR